MVILQPGPMTAGALVHSPDEQLVLRGLTAAESAASASTAEFTLHHGVSASAPRILAPANFAADGFLYPTFFPDPLPVHEGLYLNVVSGTVDVILYIDYE